MPNQRRENLRRPLPQPLATPRSPAARIGAEWEREDNMPTRSGTSRRGTRGAWQTQPPPSTRTLRLSVRDRRAYSRRWGLSAKGTRAPLPSSRRDCPSRGAAVPRPRWATASTVSRAALPRASRVPVPSRTASSRFHARWAATCPTLSVISSRRTPSIASTRCTSTLGPIRTSRASDMQMTLSRFVAAR